MPTFNIKDSKTGMEIRVSGQSAPQESDIPQLFNAARKNAEEQLATGAYKQTSDFQKISKPDQYKRIQKLAAAAIGTSVDDVDVNSGMGLWERTKLDLLRDERSRMEYLEKKFGADNVSALNVGGNTKMFYRDPKTNKMTMVDEMGASLADFTADIAGEAVTTAGAIGGAIVGSALGPGGTIAGATAGAGIGGFLTGVTQDVAATQLAGVETDTGQILKQRGIETAIGIPIDLVTGGAGKIMGRTLAKRRGIDAIDDLVRSTDELNKVYETNIRLTAAQQASPDASIAQSQRAGLDPRGREAAWYNDQLDGIGRIKKTIESGLSSDEPIESVMSRMASKHLDKLETYRARINKLDDIAIEQEAVGKSQKEAFKRNKKAQLQKQRELEHEARVAAYQKSFNKMRKNVDRLESSYGRDIREQQAIKIKEVATKNDELYEEAYRLTDVINANTPVGDVARVINRIDDSQFIEGSPELQALKFIRNRIATNPEDLTFRELDSFVKEFGDRVNFSAKPGKKYSQIQFGKVYKALNKLLDDAMGAPKKLGAKGAGAEAKKAHLAARQDFRKNVLPLSEGPVAKAQELRIGGMSGPKQASEEVTRSALQNSQTIKESLEAGVSRDTLKESYLEQITRGAIGGKVTYDRSILDKLYETTPGRAKAIQGRINKINELLEKSKIGVEDIDRDLLKDVVEAYNAPASQRAMKALEVKTNVQKTLKKTEDDILMKVIRGEQPAPGDIHIFVDSIAKKTPKQINSLMDRLSKPEQNSLRRSGLEWFLEKAGAADTGVQRTSAQTGGMALWEPDTMRTMLNNKVMRSKLEALVGKDIVKDYEKMNRVLGNAAILRGTGQGAGSRVVLTTGASGIPTPLIVSPGIPRWLGRKMLGIIHTSPLGSSMLRRFLQEPDKTSAEDIFKRIFFTSIGTRAGMASAADEAQKDPRFSTWLQESYADPNNEP